MKDNKIILNNVEEIKKFVDIGVSVFCDNINYIVMKDSKKHYIIHYIHTDYYIGLTGREGTKYENILNGVEFFYFANDPALNLPDEF